VGRGTRQNPGMKQSELMKVIATQWKDSDEKKASDAHRAEQVSARWVTLRARWVTLRARWVTLRARWVTLRARWVVLRELAG
jgi:hypothetical protein